MSQFRTIKDVVDEYGVKNVFILNYVAALSKPAKFAAAQMGIAFISTDAERVPAICSIDESRHKINDSYKIGFMPQKVLIGGEWADVPFMEYSKPRDMYQCDFNSIVRDHGNHVLPLKVFVLDGDDRYTEIKLVDFSYGVEIE